MVTFGDCMCERSHESGKNIQHYVLEYCPVFSYKSLADIVLYKFKESSDNVLCDSTECHLIHPCAMDEFAFLKKNYLLIQWIEKKLVKNIYLNIAK